MAPEAPAGTGAPAEGPAAPEQYDDALIAGVLGQTRTITMIGASANTVRPSFFVLKYLLEKGSRSSP